MDVENSMFWSEIGSGFGEPSRTPQPTKNIGTQCVLELFCEMLIRQGEVRKWLNGESFICGVFRFCYGAGEV